MSGILYTEYNNVTKTVAELNDYDVIAANKQDPYAQVLLTVADGGALDLSAMLEGNRGASVWASDAGNTITTGLRNDYLTGGKGNDTLNGGDGNDQLRDNASQGTTPDNDLLNGGAGKDFLFSSSGNDTLNGGAGDDLIQIYRSASDTSQIRIDAGADNDRIEFTAAGAAATIDGGAGRDVLSTTVGDITRLATSNVEVLEIGDTVTLGRVAQFEGFDRIVSSDTSEFGTVRLVLADGGSLDLADELGQRAAGITASDAGNSIRSGTQNDTLTGGRGNDTLDGGAGNDLLQGGAGSDRLIAGAGNDTLYGGSDSTGNGGIDTAVLSGSYSAYRIIEMGDGFTGFSGADGVKLLSNVEFVEFANGRLDLATRVFTPSTAGVTVNGTAGNDTLSPSKVPTGQPKPGAGNDTLFGFEGNDNLNGGIGADTMHGGSGNDIYTVDDAGDRVVETTNGLDSGGIDTVKSSVDFKLGAFVENLTLTGTASLEGTGNELANVITGNENSNLLFGEGGNDTLIGNTSRDALSGDDGNDKLYGGGDDDYLDGGAGNDLLTGGAGNDTMIGGSGNDTYVVDSIDDVVVEDIESVVDTGGIDIVKSSVSFGLGRFVEKLTLTGTAAIDGTGNGLDNTIVGNEAANTLRGLAGNDTISGGAGKDVLIAGAGKDYLTGGADADTFVFGAADASSVDTVRGFSAAEGDKLVFNPDDYGLTVGHGLDANGALDAAWFVTVTSRGAQGTAPDHGQFLFNKTTGLLSWDADGAGSEASQAIAVFDRGTLLGTADFEMSRDVLFL